MKFVVIRKADKDTEAGVMPTEQLVTDMLKYNEEMIKAGVMLDGMGLQPSVKGARVKFSNGRPTAIDGPFTEAKELVAGFSIIQVKSRRKPSSGSSAGHRSMAVATSRSRSGRSTRPRTSAPSSRRRCASTKSGCATRPRSARRPSAEEHAMQATATYPAPAPAAGAVRWTGRVLSALVVLFLLFDGLIKVVELPVVGETLVQLGYPPSLGFGLGVLTLAIALLYAWPRTALLGAVLLTGLLGGAIATHLRVGSPLFSHLLFGVYIGLMAWGGLILRDDRLRELLPLRR